MNQTLGCVRLKIAVDLTLWSAIKLRIAGIAKAGKKRKVTIQELIDEGR